MKKITLFFLIGLIPFFTLAQKRSLKKNTTSKKTIENNASYEFIVLKGTEIFEDISKKNTLSEEEIASIRYKASFSGESKIIIQLIFDKKSEEINEYSKLISKQNSLVSAVNILSGFGWEFHSANVVGDDFLKTHYYYLRRNK